MLASAPSEHASTRPDVHFSATSRLHGVEAGLFSTHTWTFVAFAMQPSTSPPAHESAISREQGVRPCGWFETDVLFGASALETLVEGEAPVEPGRLVPPLLTDVLGSVPVGEGPAGSPAAGVAGGRPQARRKHPSTSKNERRMVRPSYPPRRRGATADVFVAPIERTACSRLPRMARLDPHSYADDAQPRTAHFDWRARVDFAERRLHAEVTLRFAAPAAGGPLDLDTRGLDVHGVEGEDGAALPFTLAPADAILGQKLSIALPPGATRVTVRYRTSPEASALQWLEPAQTFGKEHPYVFSQCQAIHARSLVPCQDTPSIRQTYSATLDVPPGLRAVMAASPAGEHRFEMPQPIPPYLLAFAVGDLASMDLSPRSRVWAEPGELEAAAFEFEVVDEHLRVAESLFGPYDWDRFDLLVMPPSFPYGGMENPRLTFLTPTLLAGDRSLVNVVAHELAHSWTGNLVTNATAEHFWLNEGFTVFAERRILDALEGPDMAALHAAVGFQRLQKAFEQHAGRPELTRLRTPLAGIDPDDAFSAVPYEKGFLFLKTLEAEAGKEAFDALLKTWLGEHRFGAVTTDDFLALVERMLPGLLTKVDAAAWVDGEGLPASYWRPSSARLAALEAQVGRMPDAERWSPTEWQLYLETSPRPCAFCEELDARWSLTAARNAEILVSWLVLACESGHAAVLPRVEEVLGRVGRTKYVKPLFKALASRVETRDVARELFERYRATYHPITQQVVRGVLA